MIEFFINQFSILYVLCTIFVNTKLMQFCYLVGTETLPRNKRFLLKFLSRQNASKAIFLDWATFIPK